jgi:hypothetical protein
VGVWTARQIWNGLDRETREQMAQAFWQDPRMGPAERWVTLDPWLRARGMRPAYLEKRSRPQRAALMAQGGLPEETALQVLMSFHLVERSEMLARFLDELGIEHEEGLISEDANLEDVGEERVRQAAAALKESFDEDQVELYLKTLTASDAVSWEAIAPLVPDP